MSKIDSTRNFLKSTPVHALGCITAQRLLLRYLVQEHEMLLCEAIRILGTRDKAEDVLQDAAIRCLSSRAVTEAPDNPRGFLKRMVRNLALDQYRKQTRATPCCDAPDMQASGWVGVEKQLTDREDLRHLARALCKLSPKQRHAFMAARLDMRRQNEIAKQMNLSPARVHALIKAAHAQLAADMSGAQASAVHVKYAPANGL